MMPLTICPSPPVSIPPVWAVLVSNSAAKLSLVLWVVDDSVAGMDSLENLRTRISEHTSSQPSAARAGLVGMPSRAQVPHSPGRVNTRREIAVLGGNPEL